MKAQRFELESGVAVTALRTERFKASTLVFHMIVPLERERAAANALLTYVLERGSCSYPTQQQLYRALEECYSSDISWRVRKLGEMQIVSVYVDMLDRAYAYDGMDIFGQTMEVLRSMLTEPLLQDGAFLPDYVENEKKTLREEIRARVNHKSAYAITRCCTLMCGDEPYGLSELGTEEDVERLTPAALYDAYCTLLSRCRIEVFYMGSEEETRVQEAVRGLLPDFRRAYAPFPAATAVRCLPQQLRRVEEEMDAVQGKLTIGFRMGTLFGEKTAGAIPLFMQVFSASPVAKLFMNVREKRSLCYDCSAEIDSFKGVMFVLCGIENEQKNAAEEEILRQLEEIRQGNITEEEWTAARKALESGYRALYDSPAAMASWYLRRALRGECREPMEVLPHILAADKEDVAVLARSVLPDTVYFMHGTAPVTVAEEETEDV